MYIAYIKKVLQYVYKPKYNFSLPKKKLLLLFDALSLELINKSISKKKYGILHVRKETLNIVILLRIFLKFKFTFKDYLVEYISVVSPKVIITNNDNYIFFYQLKKKFKKIKFLVVQNGYRHKKELFFKELKEAKKNNIFLEVDYFFCFGKSHSIILRKFIKFNPIILGSFRNNKNKILKFKNNNKKILFASNYRSHNVKLLKNDYNVEKRFLPMLENFCEKFNISLNILGSSIIHAQEEKKYLLSALRNKNKVKFYNKKNDNNYKLIDKFKIIVFIDTTLGYEAFARRKKIAAFSWRKQKNLLIRPFGFPLIKKNKGFFFSNNDSESEVNRVLKNVIFKCNKNSYRYYFSSLEKLISYNENNKIFFSIINKILKS